MVKISACFCGRQILCGTIRRHSHTVSNSTDVTLAFLLTVTHLFQPIPIASRSVRSISTITTETLDRRYIFLHKQILIALLSWLHLMISASTEWLRVLPILLYIDWIIYDLVAMAPARNELHRWQVLRSGHVPRGLYHCFRRPHMTRSTRVTVDRVDSKGVRTDDYASACDFGQQSLLLDIAAIIGIIRSFAKRRKIGDRDGICWQWESRPVSRTHTVIRQLNVLL